jgi:catechol 2,3-dioxygenase-like lactoylglutathione lyase family enzyme
VDMRLEVVVVPVSDVDKAKGFYQGLGWRLDADFATGPDFRVVQVTPPGSPCSVIVGTGITSAAPGSAQGLQLVADDLDAARAELASHGAAVSEVFHDAGGVFHHAGTEGRVTGPAPDRKSYGSFVSFADPDGNTWFVQEVTRRLPGRATSVLAVYGSVAGLAAALRRAARWPRTASTSRRSGTRTPTGPTGTRSTWRTSGPGRRPRPGRRPARE